MAGGNVSEEKANANKGFKRIEIEEDSDDDEDEEEEGQNGQTVSKKAEKELRKKLDF